MKESNRSPQQDRGYWNDPKPMDFGSALQEALKDRKIRRLDWKDKDVYLAVKDEQLMIFKTDDSMLHPLIVSVGDITGTDWVVVEEDRVIH
jgi:hypothetical protein